MNFDCRLTVMVKLHGSYKQPVTSLPNISLVKYISHYQKFVKWLETNLFE